MLGSKRTGTMLVNRCSRRLGGTSRRSAPAGFRVADRSGLSVLRFDFFGDT
jgi:hypothetical protein